MSRSSALERLESRYAMDATGVSFLGSVSPAVTLPADLGLKSRFAAEFASLTDGRVGKTYTVTTNRDVIADDGLISLREALAAANANPGLDKINFDRALEGATIALQDRALGSLKITDDVILQGWADNVDTYFDERVTIDGGGADGFGTRPFDVDDGRVGRVINVELARLVIANGWTRATEGAGIRNAENLRLKDVSLVNNRAYWESTYARNQTTRDWNSVGGAIANYGNLHVMDSQVSRNLTVNGEAGAIYNAWNMLVEDSDISGNKTTGEGGAIVNASTGKLEIVDSVFSQNESPGRGGAISNRGALVIRDSQFASNLTRGDIGGGALANVGQATIAGTTFTLNKVIGAGAENSSLGGGAVYSEGKLQVTDSIFEKNAVNVPTLTGRNQTGGAVAIWSGAAHFNNVTFRENKARDGGALFVNAGRATVQESQFANNESLKVGGGSGQVTAVVGPAISTGRGVVQVDKATRFSNNRLNLYGNSNVANVNYKKSQRSLEFDD